MTLRAPTPAPVRPEGPEGDQGGNLPPGRNGHGNGHGGNGRGTGWPGEAPPPRYPSRRRSLWPFLLDLGLAMALFGLIITGRFLIVIGAVIFIVALIGWIREARADYSRLKD
jgi:hypothetical protein